MTNQIPEIGFLRLNQIIKAEGSSNIPIIPVSRSVWNKGVRDGMFPKPIKIGRCVAWRVQDIRDLIEKLGA